MQPAALAAAATLVLAGCGATPGAASPGASVAAPPGTSGDVPTYRGDSARTGVMPGPGPSGSPTLAWQVQADGPIRSSPAVVGGSVFVASADGVVRALRLATGDELWRVHVGTELGAASPLVIDGVVVIGDRAGVVHGLAADDGAARWQVQASGPIAGAAAEARGRALVATETGTALAIDPTSGEVRWRTPLAGGVTRSVAATEDLLYCPLSDGLLVAVRTSDGSVAWEARVASDGHGGTPAIAGGIVYAATGLDVDDPSTRGVVALDAATGDERWRIVSPEGAAMYAPAVADGRAIVVAEDHTVVAMDATTGDVEWSISTGAPNDSLPSIWGSTVLVATTGGTMQALEAATGSLAWGVEIQGIPYSPVVAGGLVLVGTSVGVLYAFGSPAP